MYLNIYAVLFYKNPDYYNLHKSSALILCRTQIPNYFLSDETEQDLVVEDWEEEDDSDPEVLLTLFWLNFEATYLVICINYVLLNRNELTHLAS